MESIGEGTTVTCYASEVGNCTGRQGRRRRRSGAAVIGIAGTYLVFPLSSSHNTQEDLHSDLYLYICLVHGV